MKQEEIHATLAGREQQHPPARCTHQLGSAQGQAWLRAHQQLQPPPPLAALIIFGMLLTEPAARQVLLLTWVKSVAAARSTTQLQKGITVILLVRLDHSWSGRSW